MFLRTSLIIFLLMAFVPVNSTAESTSEHQQQQQFSSSTLQNFSLPSELLNCSDSGQTTAAAQNLLKSCHHRYIIEGLKSLENNQPSKDSNFSLTEVSTNFFFLIYQNTLTPISNPFPNNNNNHNRNAAAWTTTAGALRRC